MSVWQFGLQNKKGLGEKIQFSRPVFKATVSIQVCNIDFNF